MKTAKHYIEKLHMNAHPEGGYYKEVYASPLSYATPNGERPLATSIYFLLENEDVSHFHELKSDELWYFHEGAPLDVYILDKNGELSIKTLGLNLDQGESPQLLVPAGTIFGSCLKNPKAGAYSLVGCAVAFGFHFDDFKLYQREELLSLYPHHKEAIVKLT